VPRGRGQSLTTPTVSAQVCADIVEHYFAKVAPLGLKAQVVAFDREFCVAYYDEITRLLVARKPELAKAAVVMTISTAKDEPAE
jgi:type I restriction enzyme, R subunit